MTADNDEVKKEDETKGPSKSQLKKLAKGKGKKKDKPDWNSQPKKEKKAKVVATKAIYVNSTPKGRKKDLSSISMDDGYHPSAVEAAWQDWWEASGYYSCDPAKAMNKTPDEKFIMVIPPPNVTGSLHLGHALTAAVEDTLTRWHRMKGHATLYVPGKFECDANLCMIEAWTHWAATRAAHARRKAIGSMLELKKNYPSHSKFLAYYSTGSHCYWVDTPYFLFRLI